MDVLEALSVIETIEKEGMHVSYLASGSSGNCTYIETPNETVRFLQQSDPAKVGWCLDVGHLAYGGGNAAPTFGASGHSSSIAVLPVAACQRRIATST